MKEFEFCYYEPWMFEQISKLFCAQYEVDDSVFLNYFNSFYINPEFQPESINIVVLENKTVAGFVSFIHWPYTYNGKTFRSFQCGNVIVNPAYRGKGLYNKMLDHLDSIAEKHKIDFVYGFPIKPILGLYLKNQWTNPLDIQWFVKFINPIPCITSFNEKKFVKYFTTTRLQNTEYVPKGLIFLNQNQEFLKWRDNYKPFIVQNKVYFSNHIINGEHVQFELKINQRKYFRELIIGKIITNNNDNNAIKEAFKQLIIKAIKSNQVSLISIVINQDLNDKTLINTLKNKYFIRINKNIHFILKKYKDLDFLETKSNWMLYRNDLDTW